MPLFGDVAFVKPAIKEPEKEEDPENDNDRNIPDQVHRRLLGGSLVNRLEACWT